jgi:HAE1 family hydrophobic/amphiphilic exporter-1/multidrug efflux pump
MAPHFFIDRPIFACVISAFILIAGLGAFHNLPVSLYPDILPPTVQVTAIYPGASADVLAETVAAPLEQSVNGVEDMLYSHSASGSSGMMNLTATFAVGTDPDLAVINVNNRVQAALPLLPEEVRRQGVQVQKFSPTILLVIGIESPDRSRDSLFVSNYTLVNVVDEIRRIPGVAVAQMFGNKDYAIRIWLQPDRLAQLGLTPSDIATAVREQNAQLAGGRVGDMPVTSQVDLTLTVTARGRLEEPEEFGNIIVRADPGGRLIRLRDVARIELGAQDYNFNASNDGVPVVGIGVFLAPEANALQVRNAIHARMTELGKGFPSGLIWKIPYDTTHYVKVSMREVALTLFEAMLLVFAVVYVFLQNWRATIIPALAVAISLIGTLAAMYAFGFSINTLTLFGMVLAIGIVVDDAIVVLENVERHMRTEHIDAKEATRRALEEVAGPVIAIVLVLTAVFIPVAFLGGLIGEMYRQFAMTIAVSVIISGFVALTLTPALCVMILRPGDHKETGILGRFDAWFHRMTDRYAHGVGFVIRHSFLAVGLIAVMLFATWGLSRAIPASLAPEEDQGWILAITILPPGASLQRTEVAIQALTQGVRQHPAVEPGSSMSFAGMDAQTFSLRTNTGLTFFPLKDWSERKKPELAAQSVVGAVYGVASHIKDAMILGINPPPISGISITGGFEGYVQSKSGSDYVALDAAVQKLIAAAAKRKEFAGVQSTFSSQVPRVRIDLDRDRAKALGVPITAVFETLQSTFGALYVNDFNRLGRVFKVQLQSESRFRKYADDVREVFVRNAKGDMIPLTALATVTNDTGPDMIERFNVFPAARIMGAPAPGYSSGQALTAMEELAAKELPDGYQLAWSGQSYQEKESSGSKGIMFVLAIVMVFLILAALYERLTLPLAIIMAVPFGVFGALLAVWLRGLQNDLYLQIGLITLVGLAAKNAILIVEFAALGEKRGEVPKQAALEAARLRFRPIIMTSLAFIFGVLPLAISTGAGAGSRHSIGTGVVGGMLMATFLAVFFVPLFYLWTRRLSRRSLRK